MSASPSIAPAAAQTPSLTTRGVVRPVSVAPMMARTDRHFRYFMRRLTRHTLLYTEMVTTAAVLHGDRDKLLGFHYDEHPIALQLGGDDPEALATCAAIAEARGYDEVNLNVGCPSDRVQNGNFGACLMAQPERVRDCVAAMRAVTTVPITVKHRIGIDDIDRYEDMVRFVSVVLEAGADRFSVHARKAWLKGLSPKENRTVPPLRYDDVYRLKRDFPELIIELNGGVRDIASVHAHLQDVDAVMIGRAAYEDPYLFATMDQAFFGDTARPVPTRAEVVEAMIPYADQHEAAGFSRASLVRHLLPMFNRLPGTRAFKRILSQPSRGESAGQLLRSALDAVQRLR